jgi:hypothetical protein
MYGYIQAYAGFAPIISLSINPLIHRWNYTHEQSGGGKNKGHILEDRHELHGKQERRKE